MSVTIGIDCGITGAIGVVKHGKELVCLHSMPVFRQVKSAKVVLAVDGAGLARMLRDIVTEQSMEHIEVVVEKTSAMPGQGVSSTYSMGHSRGVVEGVVQTLGLPMTLISPSIWKRQMGFNSDKEYVRGQMQMLFPNADLRRKKDHDKAEAIALALWLHKTKFA